MTDPIRRNVVMALESLQGDPAFDALSQPALDAQTNEFRQGVRLVLRMCYGGSVSADDLRRKLTELRELCVGPANPFRQYIDRALSGLA